MTLRSLLHRVRCYLPGPTKGRRLAIAEARNARLTATLTRCAAERHAAVPEVGELRRELAEARRGGGAA